MHTPPSPIIRFRRCFAQSILATGLLVACLSAGVLAPSGPAAEQLPLPRMPAIDGMGLAESWESAVTTAADGNAGDLAPMGYRALSHQGESYLLATDGPGVVVTVPDRAPQYWADIVARHLADDESPEPRPLVEREAGVVEEVREAGEAGWSLDGASLLKARPVQRPAVCAACHEAYGDEGVDLVLLFHFTAFADD